MFLIDTIRQLPTPVFVFEGLFEHPHGQSGFELVGLGEDVTAGDLGDGRAPVGGNERASERASERGNHENRGT